MGDSNYDEEVEWETDADKARQKVWDLAKKGQNAEEGEAAIAVSLFKMKIILKELEAELIAGNILSQGTVDYINDKVKRWK